jgi:heme exporter protein A
MPGAMRLDVSDISCDRGGRPVLRALSFGLGGGEALALRGPNGAGKSTLLRVLAGLLPARGRVVLDGADFARDPEGYGERVAYAGHLDAVKPQLTVAENLEFWAALHGADGIDAALAAFGLEAIADRPVRVCSAGQKRRAGLARLVLSPRPLWLLDEPTVSLDAQAAAALEAVLGAHLAGGGMAVVATHAPLGLAARELALRPPDAAARAAEADPFLQGDMA